MDNDFNEGAIEAQDVELGASSKVRIAVKNMGGKLFVDVRKWVKYPSSEQFVSSKKGIMIEPKDWRRIIPIITEYLEQYDDSKSANTDKAA